MTSTPKALQYASDPGSSRLTPKQVIEIHQAHMRGVPWLEIAKQMNTDRKNVSRIVQGWRWQSLHPTNRPDLYEIAEVSEEESVDELEARLSILSESLASAQAALQGLTELLHTQQVPYVK